MAVYLVQGQSLPYARTSQLLQDLLGIHLSAGSIATFVGACHQQLAEVETQIKAALIRAPVIHQDAHWIAGWQNGAMGSCLLDRSLDPLRCPSKTRT